MLVGDRTQATGNKRVFRQPATTIEFSSSSTVNERFQKKKHTGEFHDKGEFSSDTEVCDTHSLPARETFGKRDNESSDRHAKSFKQPTTGIFSAMICLP